MQKVVCVTVDGAPIITAGEGAGKAPPAAKAAAQKKVTINKPKPEQVIVISPDTEEVKQEKPVNKKKGREGSSKKKVITMTSELTATSKVNFINICSKLVLINGATFLGFRFCVSLFLFVGF